MLDPSTRERLNSACADRVEEIAQAETSFGDLLQIMAHLRSPEGCPWDAEQSLASLRQYIREESGEVCEAIDNILEYENELRSEYGIAAADPAAPDGADKARTDKKGHTIAHHPHRSDFDPIASASGAPLPVDLTPGQQKRLSALYSAMQDEVGDFMLQGAFLGDILTAMGRGGIDTSLQLIIAKLIRRHPHVYGGREVADSAEVLSNWEEIKRSEREE